MKTKQIEPIEDIAQEIAILSEGVRKLLAGRLTERALVTLIRDALPRGLTSVTKSDIREIFYAAANLKELYLKKSKRKGEDHAE